MTVYIEYVIIDNLIIDYSMLKASFSLTGTPCRKGRLFLCAFLGATIALIYPLINVLPAILILIKVFSGLLIVLLATDHKSFKKYYINCLVFFFYTFLMGGAIMGIFSLLGIDYSGEYTAAFIIIPFYALLQGLNEIVRYIYRRKNIVNMIYDAEITYGNKTMKLKGFMDTGNGLYDGNRPVIVINEKLFYKFMGSEIVKARIKAIDVVTVNGYSKKMAVELDSFKIYIKDKPNIINNVTLCVTKEKTGEADLILHPELLEVGYAEKCNNEIKKSS